MYRATDTKLGRDVALKVLPAEVAHDAERLARFHREARAVAALNHPNVVTLYSVEESGGVHFITMELIEGRPLDQIISTGGLLPERLIDIASAIAEALSAAHEKGIIHRDLKPANVMISDEGRVKVLDFGLAKDVGAESRNLATMTSDGLTQAGMVMGTPAYMSPEQVSGRALDHRSDIFSLGVVLHEMATGRRPFEGSSSAELISSILRDHPPSVTDLRPELPSDLARVIRRCLEKDPRHRMQTARDVGNEFRDLARMPSGPVPMATSASRATAVPDSGSARADEGFWVAVLPFKSASASAEIQALADGISEEIVAGLSRFSYLRVISSTSTERYLDQSLDLHAVGKELGARYVMSGNLRQVGGRLRVAARLVEVATGTQLWSETYERPFSAASVFELQDDIAARIAATVGDAHGILAHSMSEALRDKAPDQLTPYEAVLRSFAYGYRQTPEEHAAVREVLELAVEKAPGNADVWAMLARVCVDEFAHGTNLKPDPLGRMLSAARRAVDAAPSSAMAYGGLAYAMFFRKEFQAFRTAAEQSITLNPLNTPTVAGLGAMMAYSGEWERGCALVQRAMQLNPRHPGWYWIPLYCNAYRKGDYRGAVNFAIKFNLPGFYVMHEALAAAYGQLGEDEKAVASLREIFRLKPDYATTGRERLEKWFDPEFVAHFMEGLRKAGWKSDEQPKAVAVATGSGAARADEGFWVAVLPFKYTGSDADLKALAEGLSEEIITGLSRFSYLRVIARGSTAKYSNESGDVRAIGKELGARYMIEGSLRQAGSKLRLAVQLADTFSGAHLWAETYVRAFTSESVFQLQDDLVPRIVSTVADAYGVLPHSMGQAVRGKSLAELTPYEALLRSFSYAEHVTSEEHSQAKLALERAVQRAPTSSDCWAMLSILLTDGYVHGFDSQPDTLNLALKAARNAVASGPSNHKAYQALAWAQFFCKDFNASRVAAERTVALNPMDACAAVYMGQTIAFAGEWDRGCALITRAIELNSNHPGWYWYVPFLNAYRKAEYQEALNIALRIDMPGFPLASVALAAAYAQLGELEPAQKALRELLELRPDYPRVARQELEKVWDSKVVEQLLDGLRKAGMAFPGDRGGAAVPGAASQSDETRMAEGFWVAVLPFKYSGGNVDLQALAEGLSEEITTGLSRFSYLRVIARGSTAKYSSESADVRAIGKELGARYVIEGSLRHGGTKLRLTVQLVEATSGSHLWAETFERSFSPDTVFEMQDDLVPRIVSIVADQHGILPRSISAAVRKKSDDQVTPYEAVFRVFGLHEKMTAQEHAACRDLLERVVHDAPEAAECWAMLATLYADEEWFGFNLRPDPLGRAAAAAQKASDLAPASVLASLALAQNLFMRHEWQAFRPVAERTIALNPMDGAIVAVIGLMLACSGDWERGGAVADSAMRLHPNVPGWYWLAKVFNAYRTCDYRAALEGALRIQMPGYFWNAVTCAAAYGQLGERQAAQKALRELLAARPNFAATGRQELEKWFEPELAEHFMDGLRKAGLDIAGDPARPPWAAAHANVTGSGATRGAAREDEGFWVAVLPFKYTGNSTDLKALAEGLSEQVVTGFSRFTYLRVIARGSTAKYSSESGDVRAIGKELGARYVMEGSLRQAGSKLRLAVQLVEATTGSHLWAETFERTFTPETIFDLQDDLVPRIVATVADGQGILLRSMGEGLRSKPLEQMTGYEAMVRAYAYSYRFNAEEHALCRKCAERAVELAPNLSQAWAILSYVCSDEYGHDLNVLPDSLGRALKAAQRAVEADASNASAHAALAKALFLRKELPAFLSAAERAIELNPFAAGVTAVLGAQIAYAGEWERGCALVERAAQMNPRHPGWYWAAPFTYAYHRRDYRGAVQLGLKFNMPDSDITHISMAAAYGQLGERTAAEKELKELLRLSPNAARGVREKLSRWHLPELTEHFIEGLRKAGLEVEDRAQQIATPVGAATSGAVRADEGFWVAVLPFKYTGSNADLKALAEGLSEEVITGLSRFSYLRVIARGSTAKYSSESGDVRAIGKELGARYVMEASLRQAGSKLRLAVQLADTVSGAHLWAETYERGFSPEAIFELQDDLVPPIVSTVADQYGVLPHSMSEVLRQRSDARFTPHESVLRAFSYFERLTPEEHARVRQILERATADAPGQSDGWAMLSVLYWHEYGLGVNPRPNSLARAHAAARRAVEAAPSNHLAHQSLAACLFFQKDILGFRQAAERCMALNPMDGSTTAFMGILLAYAGHWERGCAIVERASQLNPNHPGWYHFAPFLNAYQKGDYPTALQFAVKIDMPGYHLSFAARAAALGQLGEFEPARNQLTQLLALRPDFASSVHGELNKWYLPDLVEQWIDGLRKAGLEILENQK